MQWTISYIKTFKSQQICSYEKISKRFDENQ